MTLKWPNDLLVDGAKCAGLLAEMASTPESQSLMVGIGLNVSTDQAILATIDQPATSLRASCGRELDPDRILTKVLSNWSEIDRKLEQDGFPAIAGEYRDHSDLDGREFRLATPGKEEKVWFVGVNQDGSLKVRRPDGSLFDAFGGELLSSQPAA